LPPRRARRSGVDDLEQPAVVVQPGHAHPSPDADRRRATASPPTRRISSRSPQTTSRSPAAEQAADTGEWLAAHPHVLVVAPDLFAGLTHEQLDEIEAWL
jgi:hypothetical protein